MENLILNHWNKLLWLLWKFKQWVYKYTDQFGNTWIDLYIWDKCSLFCNQLFCQINIYLSCVKLHITNKMSKYYKHLCKIRNWRHPQPHPPPKKKQWKMSRGSPTCYLKLLQYPSVLHLVQKMPKRAKPLLPAVHLQTWWIKKGNLGSFHKLGVPSCHQTAHNIYLILYTPDNLMLYRAYIKLIRNRQN